MSFVIPELKSIMQEGESGRKEFHNGRVILPYY